MTDAELLAAEMELGRAQRRLLALELLQLRRIRALCRKHRRSLPWQVRDQLEEAYQPQELDPA